MPRNKHGKQTQQTGDAQQSQRPSSKTKKPKAPGLSILPYDTDANPNPKPGSAYHFLHQFCVDKLDIEDAGSCGPLSVLAAFEDVLVDPARPSFTDRLVPPPLPLSPREVLSSRNATFTPAARLLHRSSHGFATCPAKSFVSCTAPSPSPARKICLLGFPTTLRCLIHCRFSPVHRLLPVAFTP